MIVLFFDTETTGLFVKNAAATPENSPHMVQFSFIFGDTETGDFEFHDYILKGDFEIPAGATAVHGITKARTEECGVLFKDVYPTFEKCLAKCEFLVAHNIDFDLAVLSMECARHSLVFDKENLPVVYCTMKKNKDRCNLHTAKGYLKYPKLSELYYHLFGEHVDNLHNALVDTLACARCFYRTVLNKEAPDVILKKIV